MRVVTPMPLGQSINQSRTGHSPWLFDDSKFSIVIFRVDEIKHFKDSP